MENRKVIGAKSTVVDDIKFRSRLEAGIYKNVFKPSNLDIRPEPFKLVLQEHFRPLKKVYKGMSEETQIQRAITYLPDFVYYNDNVPTAIIEVKGGYVTDNYPLKKKMILKIIESHPTLKAFFEIHNQREAKFCLTKLKEL